MTDRELKGIAIATGHVDLSATPESSYKTFALDEKYGNSSDYDLIIDGRSGRFYTYTRISDDRLFVDPQDYKGAFPLSHIHPKALLNRLIGFFEKSLECYLNDHYRGINLRDDRFFYQPEGSEEEEEDEEDDDYNY